MKTKYLFPLLVVFICCKKEIKVRSSFKNILIFGNSITIHVPDVSIGWYGNWGMAATSKDKDYVHVLEKLTKASIQPINISAWENSPSTFDLSSLDRYLLNNPDLILIRLGENVSEPSVFNKSLETFVARIKSRVPSAKIIITGTFWENLVVTKILNEFADKNGYMFVPLTQLARNENISFIGDLTKGEDGFIHPVSSRAVADHPGDIGMQKIAETIAVKIDELVSESF